MTKILLLGATGRTGSAILQQLAEYKNVQITAALRQEKDLERLPQTKTAIETHITHIEDVSSLKDVTQQADIIINSVRMRGEIRDDALVNLDQRIRKSLANYLPLIITVGGAGSLNMGNGIHFWEDSDFPVQTLPRGRAHTRLRHYLEQLSSQDSWAYLIPPPAYIPDGKRTGTYQLVTPSSNETTFLAHKISYEDFATAVCDAVFNRWTGIHLVGNKKE